MPQEIDFDLGNYLRRKRLQEMVAGPPEIIRPQPQQENIPVSSPEMTEYKNYLSQEPKLSEYEPTGKRKFLSRLAGVGAGLLAVSPRAGMETSRAIEYAPFNRKLQEYGQGLEQRKAAAGIGAQEADIARKGYESRARIDLYGHRGTAEQARAEAEGARREQLLKEAQGLPGSYEEAVQGRVRERQAGIRPPDPKVFYTEETGEVISKPHNAPAMAEKVGTPVKKTSAIDLQNLRHQQRMAQIKYSKELGDKDVEVSPGVRVSDQLAAERLANKRIYETHPEWQSNIDPRTLTIKTPDPQLETLRQQIVDQIIRETRKKKYSFVDVAPNSNYEMAWEDEDQEDEEEEQ